MKFEDIGSGTELTVAGSFRLMFAKADGHLYLTRCALIKADIATAEIVASPGGRDFLATHSKKDLEQVMSFVRDPKAFFPRVKRIPEFINYFLLYFGYIAASEDPYYSALFTFVRDNFSEMDEEKVPILTFLLLNSDGHLAEELDDTYTKRFGENPELFAHDLRTRKDLKALLGHLLAGDGSAFDTGLAKLQDRDLAKRIEACMKEIVSEIKKRG